MIPQSEAEAQAQILAIQPQHQTTLTTPRLTLRPVRPSDITRLHQIRQTPEVMTFMHTGAETEPNPLKSHSFSRMKMMTNPGFFSFAIELRHSNTDDTTTLIGFIGVTRPTEIFYVFDRPFWGRGYATESIGAFVPAYWARFPAGVPGTPAEERDALMAHVLDGNGSSEKVVLKAGFELLVRGFVGGEEKAVFVAVRPGCVDRDALLGRLRVKEEMTIQVVS